MPLAYFLTFTTYGTWLHGTDKGFGSVDRRHNGHGTPFLPVDADRVSAERSAMAHPAFTLGPREREVVCRAVVEMCREKGWKLWAVHVRTNHVHAVVTADREPGRLMSDLKARASQDLKRAGFDAEKRWTRHGSTRHLFDEAAVQGAVRYAIEGQGEPMSVFPPVEPRTESTVKEPRTESTPMEPRTESTDAQRTATE